MICENCGTENPNNARFCRKCGKTFVSVDANNNGIVKKEKSMILAVVISFFLAGLGIAYANNVKKGVLIFIIFVLLAISGIISPLFRVIAILLWAYALYLTYVEVEIANGISNPNLVEDWRGWSASKKISFIVVVLIVLLMVIGGVVASLDLYSPNFDNNSTDNTPSDVVDMDYLLSDGNSYDDSSGSEDEVYYYYYDVESDNDVSSEDYKIDSYTDDDGNVHSTISVDGKTIDI